MGRKITLSIIFIASIFLVLGVSFLAFNTQSFNLAGFAVYNDMSGSATQHGDNQTSVTREMALEALNESEQIIKEMQKNNFSIAYMNDTLIEAKITFQQAKYAEILRGKTGNFTSKEIYEARLALNLVNWRNIDYGKVLQLTGIIKARREKAFLIYDQIYVLNKRIENSLKPLSSSELNGINGSFMDLFEEAKTAFREDRYEEAEDLLQKARENYEANVAESSIITDLRRGITGFIQQYWVYILIVLIVFSLSSYILYGRFEKNILTSRIRKMKTEGQVLNDLMKKTQTERFRENKISGLVYNIRMKKYEERLQEIKEELPVLEERLIELKRATKTRRNNGC